MLSIMHPIYKLFDQCLIHLIYKEKPNQQKLLHHFGFLKNKNIPDLFIKLKETLNKWILEDKPILLLALDLEGAFDNIHTDAIGQGLQYLGISNDLAELTHEMIHNRAAFINTKEGKKWRHLTRGVPQGGPSSPFLFAAAAAKLCNTATGEFLPLAYAEDLTILLRGHKGEPLKTRTFDPHPELNNLKKLLKSI